jgi:hypothetical protein
VTSSMPITNSSGKPEDIGDAVVFTALETVLKPLGTSLKHYMPVSRAEAIKAMRGVLQAVRDQERERCAEIAKKALMDGLETAIRTPTQAHADAGGDTL